MPPFVHKSPELFDQLLDVVVIFQTFFCNKTVGVEIVLNGKPNSNKKRQDFRFAYFILNETIHAHKTA